ncbi:MAG: hypothetical protein ACK4RK_03305 [Gemmataceae bacterium]
MRELITVLTLSLFLPAGVWAEDMTFKVESNLKAGVAKVDITPAADASVVGHVRATNGIRDPLHGGVLVLNNGQLQVVIVTLDLLGVRDEMVQMLRDAIAEKTGTPRENILVTASHNHSGPGWTATSDWGRALVEKLADAAQLAAKGMRPVTIGYGEDRIDFNINRRKVINGRAVVRLNPDGPCDHRVKVLRLDDGTSLAPLAVLMHAVCHPCVFTWGDKLTPPYPQGYPKISADFPGEAQRFVEMVYGERTKTLFLQGCTGDIRPNLPGFSYRCGDEADIRWCGRNLGCAVVRAADRSVVREELMKRKTIYPLKCVSKILMLPGKKGEVRCELQALLIGDFLFLTMPGEPMVEYGFNLEKAIADRAIPIVVGYANGHIGYICTAASHKEGGYEPEVSRLRPEAEDILLRELEQLADRVLADTYQSIRPQSKQ